MDYKTVKSKNKRLLVIATVLVTGFCCIFWAIPNVLSRNSHLYKMSRAEQRDISLLFAAHLKHSNATKLYTESDSIDIDDFISYKFPKGEFVNKKGDIASYITECSFPTLLTCKKGNQLILLGKHELESKAFYHVLNPGHESSLMEKDSLISIAGEDIWHPKSIKEEAKIRFSAEGIQFQVNWLIRNIGVVQGGRHSVPVELSNTGKETIKIKKIHSSCSCTFGTDAEGREIEPGARHTFPITLTTGKKGGGFRHSILISLVNPRTENKIDVKLEIIGCGLDLSPISSPSNIHFAGVELNKNYRLPLSVSALPIVDLGKVSLHSSTASVIPRLVRTDQTRKRTLYIIDVVLDTAALAPGKKYEENIQIATEHDIYEKLDVPIVIETQAIVKAHPSIIAWGVQYMGHEVSKRVTIRGPIGKTLKIEKIDAPKSVRIDITKVENGFDLMVNQKMNQEGIIKDAIKVYFSEFSNPEIEVPIHAYVRKEVDF